jgi:hypothetical protein
MALSSVCIQTGRPTEKVGEAVAGQRGAPMRFPIDTSRLQFLVVGEAEPLRKFEADKPRERWAPRVDDNGEVLWRVQLVALGHGEAEIVRSRCPANRASSRPSRCAWRA